MTRKARNTGGWLKTKYGTEQKLTPWQCTYKMHNIDGNRFGQFNTGYRITYRYRRVSREMHQIDRPIERVLEIQDPYKYLGQVGDNRNTQQTSNQVFAVNGFIDKCDANLMSGFFINLVDNIDGIYAGSYPSSLSDMQKILNQRIPAVLNLQTEEDIEKAQIDSNLISKMYAK